MKPFRLFVIAALATALCSCALMQNPTIDAVLQAVIDVVVAQVLQHNPTQAQLIQTEATALQQLASGSSASVQTLSDQAAKIINSSALPAGDKAAFQALIQVAGGLLTEGQQALSPTASVQLTMIFADIANAAGIYVQSAGRAATVHFAGVGATFVPPQQRRFGPTNDASSSATVDAPK